MGIGIQQQIVQFIILNPTIDTGVIPGQILVMEFQNIFGGY